MFRSTLLAVVCATPLALVSPSSAEAQGFQFSTRIGGSQLTFGSHGIRVNPIRHNPYLGPGINRGISPYLIPPVNSTRLAPNRCSPPNFQPALPVLGFHGQASRDGMLVMNVIPGGVACQIGLDRGDLILSLDGRRIRCHQDWERALSRACDETCLKVRKPCGTIVRLHFFVQDGIAFAEPVHQLFQHRDARLYRNF